MPSWDKRRQYMRCLHAAIREINREIDAIQMGNHPSGEMPLVLYKAVVMRQELLGLEGTHRHSSGADGTSEADLTPAGQD